MTRRALFVSLCGLLLLITLWLIFAFNHRAPQPDVVFLPPSWSLKESSLKRLGVKIHNIFFKRAVVLLLGDMFSTSRIPSGEAVAGILGRRPLGETNGTMVWLLSGGDRERLIEHLGALSPDARIAKPRISTADSIEGSMFIGATVSMGGTNVDVGINFRVLPKVKDEFTVLALGFTSTEVSTNEAFSTVGFPEIETNAAFHAQVRVPKQRQVLIVTKAETQKPPVCVLIQTNVR